MRCPFEAREMLPAHACGSAEFKPLDDSVEAALQQAFDQNAGVVFIGDPGCRKALAAVAPLSGLLRY